MVFYRKSWAVIIAINDYQNEHIPTLLNAVNDGQKLSALLKNIGFETIEVYNTEANKESIMSLLVDDNNLPSKVTKEDRILIFFSGHGISIPNRRNNRKTGYIVPYDGNASAINSLIDFNDLVQKSVDNLVAKH